MPIGPLLRSRFRIHRDFLDTFTNVFKTDPKVSPLDLNVPTDSRGSFNSYFYRGRRGPLDPFENTLNATRYSYSLFSAP